MAELVVRRKSDNVVEYVCGIGSFVDADSEHFTIDLAEDSWGLPQPGWPKSEMEGISLDSIPDGFNAGSSVLNGSDGNYTWSH